jgi:hypothetical protein
MTHKTLRCSLYTQVENRILRSKKHGLLREEFVNELLYIVKGNAERPSSNTVNYKERGKTNVVHKARSENILKNSFWAP